MDKAGMDPGMDKAMGWIKLGWILGWTKLGWALGWIKLWDG